MTINKENIEVWIFDYLEGNLSKEGTIQFNKVINENPDFKAELSEWSKLYTHTDTSEEDYQIVPHLVKQPLPPSRFFTLKKGLFLIPPFLVALYYWGMVFIPDPSTEKNETIEQLAPTKKEFFSTKQKTISPTVIEDVNEVEQEVIKVTINKPSETKANEAVKKVIPANQSNTIKPNLEEVIQTPNVAKSAELTHEVLQPQQPILNNETVLPITQKPDSSTGKQVHTTPKTETKKVTEKVPLAPFDLKPDKKFIQPNPNF